MSKRSAAERLAAVALVIAEQRRDAIEACAQIAELHGCIGAAAAMRLLAQIEPKESSDEQ